MSEKLNPSPEELLPHASPMVLIDKLVELDQQVVKSQVVIQSDSMFIEEDGVPAYVGIEYMAQTVGLMSGMVSVQKAEAVGIGFLIGAPAFETHIDYFPVGMELEVVMEHYWGDDQLMQFEGKIYEIGKSIPLVEGRLSLLKPKDENEFMKGIS